MKTLSRINKPNPKYLLVGNSSSRVSQHHSIPSSSIPYIPLILLHPLPSHYHHIITYLTTKTNPHPETKPTSTLCVITSNPARFRDPSTGLPYSSAYAYREIQKLKKGEYRWSRLVGAYVGQGTYAARGVPPRFTNPKAQLFLKMAGAGTGAELFVPSGAGGAQGQGQSQTQGQNLVPGVKLSR